MFAENFKDYKIEKDGTIFSLKTGRKIKQRQGIDGYWTVFIRDNSGDYRTVRAHRLVAQVYLDNPDGLPEVNHKDGDKNNNHLDNLEWVTSKENKEHAWGLGLYTHKCENHYATELTEEEIRGVCQLLQDGYRNSQVSEVTGIPRQTIANIKSKRVWKDVVKDYSFKVKRTDRKDLKTVKVVCELLEQGLSVKEIHKRLSGKVKEYDIRRIKNRKIFKTVSSEYNF